MSSDMYNTLSVIRGSLKYNSWLYSRIEKHLQGTVLDIGSGLGDIARQFVAPSVDEVILSDYAEEMVSSLRQTQLPLKKSRIIQLDITSPNILKDHPGAIADTVTCINVLEHIEDDVAALKNMKHMLKKGGRVVIFVPAVPAIYGTLDLHVEHFRRYTEKTLSAAMQSAGLKVKEAHYMNMFGILTWFTAGRVLKQKRFHKNACHMLDKTVPVLRALESFGPPPIGQSLIMVGELT